MRFKKFLDETYLHRWSYAEIEKAAKDREAKEKKKKSSKKKTKKK